MALLNPENEDTFPLSDGPPRVGKSRQSLRKYIKDGVKILNTQVIVKLDHCQLTSGLGTSMEAWKRFNCLINGIEPSQ